MSDNIICSFSVPKNPKEEELVKRVKEYAKLERRSFSFIVLEALKEYMEEPHDR
jgi:hypothetical protein